jgi:hypothetical protein
LDELNKGRGQPTTGTLKAKKGFPETGNANINAEYEVY